MRVVDHIIFSVSNVIATFFSSDMDVVSEDTKKVLANPEDKKRYIDAVSSLKEKKSKSNNNDIVSTEITLTNNSKIELTL